MLTIIMGRAKTGKSSEILRRIAELSDHGKQILLVPEHASHQAEIDLCRVCGDTVSRHAEVLSFRRLRDRVLSECGGIATVSLDAGGKLLALQRALTGVSASLRVYQRPSQKAPFLKKLLDLFDEFQCYGVTPQTLLDEAQSIPSKMTREKLWDLGLILGEYQLFLEKRDIDTRDRMTQLGDALERSFYLNGKDVFLDGFTYFNLQERRVLRHILRSASSVTVTLLGEPHSTEEMFETSIKTCEQLQRLAEEAGCPVTVQERISQETGPLAHLERCFFGDAVAYHEPQDKIRIREADTVFSEAEQTAAEILRLVAAGACRYRDITVAARNLGDYESVIETVFERYGIPIYLNRRSDLLEKPVLSLITGVLASICNGYEYDDMFRWLKTGLAGLTAEECDLLENYVLKWEIHGHMWLREQDWIENPDGYGAPWHEEHQTRLAQVNSLRQRVCQPLSRLVAGLRGETAAQKANALYEYLEELGIQQALEAQMHVQASEGRLQDAEETAQLWDILCGVLDQFVELLGDQPLTVEDFSQLLRQILAEYSVGTIPVSLDQVTVSEITRNDRHTAKYLFLLGVNDHVLPDPGQSSGILNEDDRDELALMGVELAPSGMDRMGMELQSLYAALAQPTEGLWISYPISDISGSELRPAFVVERLRTIFPDLSIEKERQEKDYRLTAVIPALEAAGSESDGALWQWFREKDAFRSRLEAMERAAKLKRGSLSRNAVRALYGDHISMSASRVERLRSCHFAYFMEYGLRAKARTAAAFDAPQIGTFLHYLLENVTRDVLKQGGFAQVDEECLHSLVRKYIDCYVAQELHNFQGRDARFRYLFDRLRNTAYAVIDQIAQEMRCSDFIPLEFELSFGDHGDLPAIVISEPDAELRVGGKVDRVDGWVKDGKLYLRVVDYKSGKKRFDLSAVKMGLDIQLLLYLFTLQKEGKSHFGGLDIEPAGVLYLPARNDILSAERNISPEKLESERQKQLRRSGLLLAEPAVLQAMEHDSLTEPHYLPLRVSRDGSLSGSIASAAQLGKLGQYVQTLLRQISDEIRQGNIDADPCCHSEDDSFCKYCDWASACHFQDGRDGDHLHYILPVKPEEFWKSLEEQEGENG